MTSEDKYEDQFLTRSDVLTILLNIIADTGLPTTSFLVDLVEDGGCGGCGIDPRRLSNLPNLHGRTFVAAWVHIRELMLDYKMESRVAVDMGIAFKVVHVVRYRGRRSIVSEAAHAYGCSSTTNTTTGSHTQQHVCIRG